jgi:hypothetical protein
VFASSCSPSVVRHPMLLFACDKLPISREPG